MYKKRRRGKRSKLENRAEEAAKHLYGVWKRRRTEYNTKGTYIINEDLLYNTDIITMKELKKIIKKFKRRKAPGPD